MFQSTPEASTLKVYRSRTGSEPGPQVLGQEVRRPEVLEEEVRREPDHVRCSGTDVLRFLR